MKTNFLEVALVVILYVALLTASLILEVDILTVVLGAIGTLVGVATFLILIDALYFKLFLIHMRIGENNFVLLGNLDGVVELYLARRRGYDYNPKTGKLVQQNQYDGNGNVIGEPVTQSDYYESPFLNWLANKWGVYYKGLNMKPILPTWVAKEGGDYRIPFTKIHEISTDGCLAAGLSFITDTSLIVDQVDLSKYLVISDEDAFKQIEIDYKAGLRTYFVKKGEELATGKEGHKIHTRIREIAGVKTEGQMEELFKEEVYDVVVATANRVGKCINNLSLINIRAGNTNTETAEERILIAQQKKQEAILASEGEAQAIRNVSVEKAAAIKREGDQKVGLEKEMKKEGIDRLAVAIENHQGTLVINGGNSGINLNT